MGNLRTYHFFSVVILAILFSFPSCKVQELDFNGVNNVSIGSMKSDNIEITLNVKLDNPNNFKIKVVNAKLDLFIGGNEAGVASLDDKVIIKKKTEGDYDIIITTDREQLMSAAVKSAISSFGSGKITVKVKGWVKGRVWGIGKKIDVEFKENVDMDMLKGLR
jgi:LEA14-like dessication related protein